MMADLRPVAPDLAKLIPLLASNRPGEVSATIEAIRRKLSKVDADFHDLAAAVITEPSAPAEATQLDIIERLAAIADTLPAKQRDFVINMFSYSEAGRRISPKQQKYLSDLYVQYVE